MRGIEPVSPVPTRADRVIGLLDASRVPDSIHSGSFGPWEIRRFSAEDLGTSIGRAAARSILGRYPTFTALFRQTSATMHLPVGESVMEDSERELRRHLPILLAARGRVLVSGLGLGCVVRGLLANAAVTHIDVIELDHWILNRIGPTFAGDRRVTLHYGDALTFDWPPAQRWDYAWHDIWSPPEGPHLQVLHARLVLRYRDRVALQGCWEFPRQILARSPIALLGQRRRKFKALVR